MVADPLVSTAWLADNLSAPDIKVVDASWYFPHEERDAEAEYRVAHIPGAVFFDIDEIADQSSDLPHMLPDAVKFSARTRKLGLGDGSRIVVYDQLGLRSAARVWWTFRVMGHNEVFVLDGGLPKWIAEGRPVEDLPPPPQDRHFSARFDSGLVRSLEQMRKTVDTGAAQIIDARPGARFTGEAPEPRAGLRGGHMPGAFSVPSSALLAPDGTVLPAERLETLFKDVGVDLDRPIVTSCGSGITAAMLALALARLGRWRTPVYDGSWAEWGAKADTPIVTGP